MRQRYQNGLMFFLGVVVASGTAMLVAASSPKANNQIGRFQIVASDQGVYMWDTATGKVWNQLAHGHVINPEFAKPKIPTQKKP